MRVAVVSITRHGIALAGRIVAALPGAQLFAPEKFRVEAESAAAGAAHCYQGKVGDQVPAVSRAVGRTRPYVFNPRYPFLTELKALLEKALSFYPATKQDELKVNRRRPRAKGKNL